MTESLHTIDELLAVMVERDASDLHMTAGSPPVIRINGQLERLVEYDKLSPEETRTLIYRIISTEQQKHLETGRQIDFSHSVPGLARFRVNAFFQRESLAAAFRLIPARIKTLEELNMPSRLYELADKPRGLVLITARPAPASRPRSRRCSITSTARDTSTSSRSRIQSNFCTGTARASSTSASSAPTRRRSVRPCARRSAKTRT